MNIQALESALARRKSELDCAVENETKAVDHLADCEREFAAEKGDLRKWTASRDRRDHADSLLKAARQAVDTTQLNVDCVTKGLVEARKANELAQAEHNVAAYGSESGVDAQTIIDSVAAANEAYERLIAPAVAAVARIDARFAEHTQAVHALQQLQGLPQTDPNRIDYAAPVVKLLLADPASVLPPAWWARCSDLIELANIRIDAVKSPADDRSRLEQLESIGDPEAIVRLGQVMAAELQAAEQAKAAELAAAEQAKAAEQERHRAACLRAIDASNDPGDPWYRTASGRHAIRLGSDCSFRELVIDITEWTSGHGTIWRLANPRGLIERIDNAKPVSTERHEIAHSGSPGPCIEVFHFADSSVEWSQVNHDFDCDLSSLETTNQSPAEGFQSFPSSPVANSPLREASVPSFVRARY